MVRVPATSNRCQGCPEIRNRHLIGAFQVRTRMPHALGVVPHVDTVREEPRAVVTTICKEVQLPRIHVNFGTGRHRRRLRRFVRHRAHKSISPLDRGHLYGLNGSGYDAASTTMSIAFYYIASRYPTGSISR